MALPTPPSSSFPPIPSPWEPGEFGTTSAFPDPVPAGSDEECCIMRITVAINVELKKETLEKNTDLTTTKKYTLTAEGTGTYTVDRACEKYPPFKHSYGPLDVFPDLKLEECAGEKSSTYNLSISHKDEGVFWPPIVPEKKRKKAIDMAAAVDIGATIMMPKKGGGLNSPFFYVIMTQFESTHANDSILYLHGKIKACKECAKKNKKPTGRTGVLGEKKADCECKIKENLGPVSKKIHVEECTDASGDRDNPGTTSMYRDAISAAGILEDLLEGVKIPSCETCAEDAEGDPPDLGGSDIFPPDGWSLDEIVNIMPDPIPDQWEREGEVLFGAAPAQRIVKKFATTESMRRLLNVPLDVCDDK